MVNAAPYAEYRGKICAAHTHLQYQVAVSVEDILYAEKFGHAALFVGYLGAFDDGHTVKDIVKLFVEFFQVGEIFFAVLCAELREIDAAKRLRPALVQPCGEVPELFGVSCADEYQGYVIGGKRTFFGGKCQGIQQAVDVLLGGFNAFLGTGILKAQHYGGKTRHCAAEYLRGEILGAGHIHRSTETILQKFSVGIFIEVLRRTDEIKIGVIEMMTHRLMTFLL